MLSRPGLKAGVSLACGNVLEIFAGSACIFFVWCRGGGCGAMCGKICGEKLVFNFSFDPTPHPEF